MSDATARMDLPLLAAGQAQKELFHNEALTVVDLLLHPAAVSAGATMPPVAPQPGQCWIVGQDPTGAWAGHDDAVAGWTTGGWRFVRPVPGMEIWVDDIGLTARWTTAGWDTGRIDARQIRVDGQQVVAGRQPAIAAPAAGSVIDQEARTAIEAILAALQKHGLIAK
jgi:hypothetical protein